METTDRRLVSLRALWLEKRASRLMPSRAEMTVKTLRPWLGYLALIDVRGEPNIFRLCGTRLLDRFQGEMTRREISALENQAAQIFQTQIAQVCKTKTTLFGQYTDRTGSPTRFFDELFLPLGADGVNTDTVLFASYAETPKGRATGIHAQGQATGIGSQWM